jgi:hypothetical protein
MNGLDTLLGLFFNDAEQPYKEVNPLRVTLINEFLFPPRVVVLA